MALPPRLVRAHLGLAPDFGANLSVTQACTARELYSPIGCALARGRIPLGTPRGDAPSGLYWAWLNTGDTFLRAVGRGAPTEGSTCRFEFRTVHDAGCHMATYLSTGDGRPGPVADWLRHLHRLEAGALHDHTGSPGTYVEAGQLTGTAFRASGPLTQVCSRWCTT